MEKTIRVLVTGARGFIGKNLVTRLREFTAYEVVEFVRGDCEDSLRQLVTSVDAVVHLAGENRPLNPEAFESANCYLTQKLCEAVRRSGKHVPLILASSIQAELDNPYGRSKRVAEQAVEQLAIGTGNPVSIYRLPGVFGKWCRPNYNSVVATFCHNTANDLPIHVNDPSMRICLVYVDDVVNGFITELEGMTVGICRNSIQPEYSITLGELAEQILAFKNCRTTLISEPVGTGLTRALYATYVSYLPIAKLVYDLPCHGDERGVFVEMLKTKDAGQFSYFTAHPGVTRGGHYHHSKTEKFLVIKGNARFGFRNIITNETHEIYTSGDHPQVLETVPGWIHNITNIGEDEMVVMLWANEIFDPDRPDTIIRKV